MFGKGNKSCSRKKQGTYIMDVGRFAKAYVAQKRVDYQLMGKDYDKPDALDYLECTAQQYNDNYVSCVYPLFFNRELLMADLCRIHLVIFSFLVASSIICYSQQHKFLVVSFLHYSVSVLCQAWLQQFWWIETPHLH